MDNSKVKEYAEEIKKEIVGLFPTINNKQDLIKQLCEKDEENNGYYVDLKKTHKIRQKIRQIK